MGWRHRAYGVEAPCLRGGGTMPMGWRHGAYGVEAEGGGNAYGVEALPLAYGFRFFAQSVSPET